MAGREASGTWAHWYYGTLIPIVQSIPLHLLILVLSDNEQGAILASLFASAFTWPLMQISAYSTQGCWFGGLMLIISSITIATQQSITLHRFSTHVNDLRNLRGLLGYQDTPAGIWRPRKIQLYVWQMPVMMLRFGIYLFLVGLFLLLWKAARPNGHSWSMPDLKVSSIDMSI